MIVHNVIEESLKIINSNLQQYFLSGFIIAYAVSLYLRSLPVLANLSKLVKVWTSLTVTLLVITPIVYSIISNEDISLVMILISSSMVFILDVFYLFTFMKFLHQKSQIKKELLIISKYSAICTALSLIALASYVVFVFNQNEWAYYFSLLSIVCFGAIFGVLFGMTCKLENVSQKPDALKTQKIKRKSKQNLLESTLHGHVDAGPSFVNRMLV
jgi:hypothetical protein